MPPSKNPPTAVWMRDRTTRTRPVVTEDKIVRTAIALADAEGLDALSMRRIASEMGSGTTSLYRYVASKDELIELMVDAIFGAEPLPEATGGWRDELAAVARHYRGVLLRHPWLAVQAARRPALGPNVIARADHELGIVSRVTDDPTLASMVVNAINTHVLGAVSAELAELEVQRRTGMTEDEWRDWVGAYVRQVVESGRYPHFNRRVLEAGDPDPAARFEFGLDCLLTGIEAALRAS
ncbi:TetR/AcrR family transcriptional regulator [Amycolatopsis thermophila]|uniref:AcrR family transcriptional regulator n=1 Tax=Amycolatopsis thermophila TaxID=206084 RepID=A0ABU0EZV2_9PSEU|nr:TetR/AcrR family transcriptional regulator [Amycolatopsis thermophila]MDQ0380634.1 AcrR family transcriptional regulator [Amycolatopsis thermophila]